MYITNIIPPGKCFVPCLHTRCFVSEISLVCLGSIPAALLCPVGGGARARFPNSGWKSSLSFASLTCSISDTPQLVCKHRTRALSMKYSICISQHMTNVPGHPCHFCSMQ